MLQQLRIARSTKLAWIWSWEVMHTVECDEDELQVAPPLPVKAPRQAIPRA